MQQRTRLRPRAVVVRAVAVTVGALGLVTLGAMPATAAPAAATVAIGGPTTATVGDTFDVRVDLTGTADVYAYEIVLHADADAVTAVADGADGPDGGFDTVQQRGDTITLAHTRLGTSPALSGDLTETAALTATAPGSLDVSVVSVTLLDGTAGSTPVSVPVPAGTTLAVTVAPLATASPSPSPTATSGAGTSAGGDPSTGGTGATAVSRASRTAAGGELAWTGADVAPWAAASLALLLAGGAVLVARTRAARRRVTGGAE